MRRNKFLALIAIFATLFMNFGTLFAQSDSISAQSDSILVKIKKDFKQIKMTKGHHKNVTSVSCSPDGKYVLSGSTDSTLILWNPKSGARLNPLKGHNSFVECVSWSPDGTRFASGSLNGGVIIWDANSLLRVHTLKGHTFGVESICWSPDGKYLASGAGDQTVRIWSEETEYIYRDVPFPDRKPVRDTVNTENKPENGVETDQAQIEEPAKKVIKKSIEKSESKILIKEYDQQGKLIKITDKYIDDVDYMEFTLRDGKILSAKASGSSYSDVSVDKQNNTAYYSDVACDIKIKFDELGYKEEKYECQDGGWENFYEYNKDGLLEKEVCTSSSVWEPKPTKTTTTYTYDVMSQDWTKRTGTQTASCISNKTKKTKVMGTSTSTTTRTVEYW